MPRVFLIRRRLNLKESNPQSHWRPVNPPPSPEDDVKEDLRKSASSSKQPGNQATSSSKPFSTASSSTSLNIFMISINIQFEMKRFIVYRFVLIDFLSYLCI
uniref:Uncharacterized protein n=1 Tax=Tetranychus urticae TaxID=32264 RepID=T1KTA3_TETUR